MKIAIIDYRAGNIASVANALEKFGYEYEITRDPKVILAADKVIFPGQGRAAPAMKDLQDSGLDTVIKEVKVPFLGICLGMQLLLPFSEEDETEGLGLIDGRVRKFLAGRLKVPQMGWNTVTARKWDTIFASIPDVFYAYFANSYYVDTNEKNVLAFSQYGPTRFASMIRKDNFFGVQFHPEKSSLLGLQILRNFCKRDFAKNETLIFPAIDLIGGKCVRLYQGNYKKQTTYNADPITQAKKFIDIGAKYLHVIDLEGAKKGQPMNADTIISIVKNSSVPVQVGGGIRKSEDAKKYLDSGAARIILSTAALSDPELIQDLIAQYGPGRIVVSIDAKDGKVAVQGWRETSETTVASLLNTVQKMGVTTIVFTDIKSDGTLKGPNFGAVSAVVKSGLQVIVAGGVSSVEHVERLLEMGVYGAIVGKALYEGDFDLKLAVSRVPQSPPQISLKPANTVTKRIIACMDIQAGRVVKGSNFVNLRDAGDPVELGRQYSESGADELVFLDITATVEERKTLSELVSTISKNINIPFTVGGGIKSVEDIRALLAAGADKVSIGSAAVNDPALVGKAAQEFGSQCIVISVDPKKRSDGTWEIYVKGGREATGIDAIEFCKEMQNLGAGELLVNSLDRDGTEKGYDLELLKAISNSVSIPVIASSGAGTMEHFADALTKGGTDAVLAATLFHYQRLNIQDLKKYLVTRSIAIRI